MTTIITNVCVLLLLMVELCVSALYIGFAVTVLKMWPRVHTLLP